MKNGWSHNNDWEDWDQTTGQQSSHLKYEHQTEGESKSTAVKHRIAGELASTGDQYAHQTAGEAAIPNSQYTFVMVEAA